MAKKSKKGGTAFNKTWALYTGIQLGLLALGLYVAGARDKGLMNLIPVTRTTAQATTNDARTPASTTLQERVKTMVQGATARQAGHPFRAHNKFAD